MIIWINGAFGAGKTQTALELHRRLKNSYIYDPENLGAFINNNIPKNMLKDDFQDHTLWWELNLSTIKYIHDNYNATIIIPMTLVDPKYFNDIIGNLRKYGIVINHFTLMVSKENLIRHLKLRGDNENSWPAKQIKRCMKSLDNEFFENKIYTDNMTIYEVSEEILKKL